MAVRYVEMVFLPGDREMWHLSRIRNREARLTLTEERVRSRAFMCAHQKRNNPRWMCTSETPCWYCIEVKHLCK